MIEIKTPSTILRIALVVVLAAFIPLGCGDAKETGENEKAGGSDKAVEAAGRDADDLESFTRWARALVAEPRADVLLTDAEAWFGDHFPAETAAALTTEYAELTNNASGLITAIETAKADGKTEVETIRIASGPDEQATGLQNAALQKMTSPVALYTMRMKKPGEDSGYTLWSFVNVEGSFRFVGKMRAAK